MKIKVFIVVDDPIMGNLLEVRLTEADCDACYMETADQVFAGVSEAAPSVRPVVVTDADPSAEGESILARLKDMAVDIIAISSPFNMDELLVNLSALEAPEEPSLESDLKFGAAAATGLPGLLNSFHERGITGLLEVRDLPEKAAIHLDGGEIVHAVYGNAAGQKALHRIMRAKDGAPQFHPQPRLAAETRTIQKGFHALLDEAQQETKTLEQIKQTVFDSVLKVDDDQLARLPEIQNHRGLSHVLSLVAEHEKMRLVLDHSRMTDLKTYVNLVYLLKKGVVKARSRDAVGIYVVSDSAADLPEYAAQDLDNIRFIPLSVRIDGKTYRDGLDIGPKRFFDIINKTKVFPETAPPSPEDFHAVFESVIGDSDILGIFLSGELSDSVKNARIAVERYGDACALRRQDRRGKGAPPQIEIIDSRTLSMGLGLLAVAAAEKAAAGANLEEVRDHVAGLIPLTRTFFAPGSLNWLYRSGRLTRGKAAASTVLGLRPIMGIHDGQVIILDKVVGEKAVPDALLEWIEWSLPDPSAPLWAGVAHTDLPDQADRLAATLAERFDCRRTMVSGVGPVTGIHCGPGTLGVAVLPLNEINR